jgi:hypothetical protein
MLLETSGLVEVRALPRSYPFRYRPSTRKGLGRPDSRRSKDEPFTTSVLKNKGGTCSDLTRTSMSAKRQGS